MRFLDGIDQPQALQLRAMLFRQRDAMDPFQLGAFLQGAPGCHQRQQGASLNRRKVYRGHWYSPTYLLRPNIKRWLGAGDKSVMGADQCSSSKNLIRLRSE